jgi:hypothetical protein
VTAPEITLVVLSVTALLTMLGLHLFVVRPRRGRSLRALATERGGTYARGRAVIPVEAGEAEVGARHVSVPCAYQPEFFVFARSLRAGQKLSLGARELAAAPGAAGTVLPVFGERLSHARVVEVREGRLHVNGHEASRDGAARAALQLAEEMAGALQSAPSTLWPELSREHGLVSDLSRLAGQVQGFPVEVRVSGDQVDIVVRGAFGPLDIQGGRAGIPLDNPVLGATLGVESEDPDEARRRLSSDALTTPLLELVLDHGGRVLPDRIEVRSLDFGEAAVRQRLDGALSVATLLG